METTHVGEGPGLRNGVVKPSLPPEFKRILLVTHLDDDASKQALAAAAMLARASGGLVYVLCVLEVMACERGGNLFGLVPDTHAEAARQLLAKMQTLRELGVSETRGGIEQGVAEDVILRRTNADEFDVVVLGSTRYRRGTNAYVMAHARIPVLAVPCNRS
jgi:nucleotide-binding universal stress UspA family protein